MGNNLDLPIIPITTFSSKQRFHLELASLYQALSSTFNYVYCVNGENGFIV